jgi:hypothetical protein
MARLEHREIVINDCLIQLSFVRHRLGDRRRIVYGRVDHRKPSAGKLRRYS